MNKIIRLGQNNIEYDLKKSRRYKRVRLAVHSGGNLIVTCPESIGQDIIEGYIIRKAQWILNKINYFKSINPIFFVRSSRRDYFKYRGDAKIFVTQKIEQFNKVYNFKFKNISIKNQKTRWGSCSTKGNLNFNYKIMLIPGKVADYIIVHELCHLCEFNHSKNFWNLVARAIPDYREIRKELKHGKKSQL